MFGQPLSVWIDFNRDHWSWANLAQGSYGYITVLHELGHGMGLGHPHDGGGVRFVIGLDPTAFPGIDIVDDDAAKDTGDNGLNQGIWTVMSYNDGYDQRPAASDDYGWEGTLMAFDIAALQALYGANTDYRNGDDTYYLPTATGAGTFWSCIWDGGGDNDTISNAWSDLDCTIDLRAATLQNEPGGGGFVSAVDGVIGGFTIANGAWIENAVGGSGNDTLIGNGGSNRLDGGAGDDTVVVMAGGSDILEGGTGRDTLSFAEFTTDITFDLGSGFELLAFYPRASIRFSSFENVRGGAGNDTISGDDGGQPARRRHRGRQPQRPRRQRYPAGHRRLQPVRTRHPRRRRGPRHALAAEVHARRHGRPADRDFRVDHVPRHGEPHRHQRGRQPLRR